MYNDLLLDRLAAVAAEDDQDERISELITEIEELDNLLSPEAQNIIRDLRPVTVSDDVYDEIDETSTFGERMADRIAELAGSWGFIIAFLMLMLVWMGTNFVLGTQAFDPFPFILLNLTLSTLAALQAPVILMSQNRQSNRDRKVARNDYEVNLKNELELVDLHRKLDMMVNAVEVQSRVINALANARRQELSATVKAMTTVTRKEDLL
ncbi:MAG TPA: DUF1003 domain-containing protein [Phototrophicaceae bacterium]|nr:DUF1003 domain-containing protein [Phototrophicaceae bacterium]